MNKLLPLVAFIVICLADFIGIYFEYQLVIYIAKPLLMVSLFWYYNLNTETINKLFVYGLFFSFLGDVFLLGKGELFFILGLASFLIAHFFYIFMVAKMLSKVKPMQLLFASIPFILLFIFLLNILYDSLGAMKIPVIIYALTISVFGIVSLLLHLQKKVGYSIILLIGVLFFITSDSILAINLFHFQQSYFPLLIMFTYVTAQFLICSFVLKLNTKK